MAISEVQLEVRTIRGEASWILRSSCVEMALTQCSGHMAPVVFGRDTAKPIEPYAISPWQGEPNVVPPPGSERMLRGDFFCLPFGSGPALEGEQHPKHGATSSELWTLVEADSAEGVHTLAVEMETPVRAGRVRRTFTLRDGHHAVYSLTEIDGFAGPATLGHHAVLALPETEGALLVSSSEMLFGATFPGQFAGPENGSAQSVAMGAAFESLARVPAFAGDGTVDCSSFPLRPGHSDLLQIAQKPRAEEPCWMAAVNTEQSCLWFAFKDPAVLPSTLLSIENRGPRHAPWSGRTCTLGLEDVCTYFDLGIAAAMRPNPFSERGVRTAHELTADAPFKVRYVQGAVAVPEGFGRVERVRFGADGVVFVDAAGLEVRAVVDAGFVLGGPRT